MKLPLKAFILVWIFLILELIKDMAQMEAKLKPRLFHVIPRILLDPEFRALDSRQQIRVLNEIVNILIGSSLILRKLKDCRRVVRCPFALELNVKMGQNGLFFRNLNRKLGKKIFRKFFFVSMGV